MTLHFGPGINLNKRCILLSPSNFNNNANANELYVTSSGELNDWGNVTTGYGVRPVINLDTKNIKFTGTGTMQDPFVVE